MERNLKTTARNFLALSLALGLTGSIALADPGHKDEQSEMAEGESHSHEAPHGGTVKTAGDYHVELVVKPAGSMKHHDGEEHAEHGEKTEHHEHAEYDEKAEHGEKAEHDEQAEHGEKAEHDEHAEHEDEHAEHDQGELNAGEVWSCTMDPQVRESAAGKCPICGMNLTLAKDGAAHLEVYIYGGEDSAGKPIAAEALSAYLQVPNEEGFRNTALRPDPLAGEEEGTSSHFVGMIEPRLADTGFTATLRIPIDGESQRVAFHIKPEKSHHEDGHQGHKKHDEADGHGGEHAENGHADKKSHH